MTLRQTIVEALEQARRSRAADLTHAAHPGWCDRVDAALTLLRELPEPEKLVKWLRDGEMNPPNMAWRNKIGDLIDLLQAELSSERAAREKAEQERDALIASTGEHITVRSEYLARAEKAEAALAAARDEALETVATELDAIAASRLEIAARTFEMDAPYDVADEIIAEFASERAKHIRALKGTRP